MNFSEEIEKLKSQLSAIEQQSAQLRGELSSLLNQAIEAEKRKKEAESIIAAAAAMMADAKTKQKNAEDLLAKVQSKISNTPSPIEQPKETAPVEEPKEIIEQKAPISEPKEIITPEPKAAEPKVETKASVNENAPKPQPGEDLSIGMPVTDIRKAISIGDRFLFQRELFIGNGEVMNKTIDALNELNEMEEAMAYINSHFSWDKESQAYGLFINVLKRRF